jgi:hypothetical protein
MHIQTVPRVNALVGCDQEWHLVQRHVAESHINGSQFPRRLRNVSSGESDGNANQQ